MRARHVYPDGVIRMVCVLRVTMMCVARVLRRKGPYNVGGAQPLRRGNQEATHLSIACNLCYLVELG